MSEDARLTPEREAEIRRCLCDADLSEEWLRLQLGRVLAALDAERLAHAQARTALTGQAAKAIEDVKTLRAALLEIAESYEWEPYEDGESIFSDPQIPEIPTNRRIAREALGLARPATEDA